MTNYCTVRSAVDGIRKYILPSSQAALYLTVTNNNCTNQGSTTASLPLLGSGFQQTRNFSSSSSLPILSSSSSWANKHRKHHHHPSNNHLRHNYDPSIRNASTNTKSNSNDDDVAVKHTSSLSDFPLDDIECNVPSTITSRVGTNLHLQSCHPLNTIKNTIERYWNTRGSFRVVDHLSPIVSTNHNFDSLLIAPDHVSRSKSDTYYLNKETVLRTHTSAHQTTLLEKGYDEFLVTGDVYRRDEIDSSHYPIFHQMEGVKMFTPEELSGASTPEERLKIVEQDLKHGLEGMAKELFGDVEMRWVDAYFPFTTPSYELEIYFENEWLEVLGCGVIEQEIIKSSNRTDPTQIGWAFGLGLERLAMVLFQIPDIRLFWSTDERFSSQFESGEIIKFVPYSKYPPCFKDISFWIDDASASSNTEHDSNEEDLVIHEGGFHPNDFNEGVRHVAGDLVERVELIDTFVHPKTNKTSNCFRITYRSMDRSLTNEEVDRLQEQVREYAQDHLGVELR